ncbi:MAG: FtsH protease activity modulator HflK [Fibrobacterales bacterium]
MSESKSKGPNDKIAWLLLLVIAAGLVLYYFQKSFFVIVESYEKAVVFNLGVVDPVPLEEGPHMRLPYPIQDIILIDVEKDRKITLGFEESDSEDAHTNRHKPKEALVLTADANIVDVEAVINYKINDPVTYVTKIEEPEETIRDASESALKAVIGLYNTDDILTEKKAEIADEVFKELQKVLDKYDMGISIQRVQLVKVLNPKEVREAFESVESAKQDSAISVEKALGYQNKEVPKARGYATKTIKGAEAYAITRIAEAEGNVAEFKEIYAKYKGAKAVTKKRLYLEAMEEVLPDVKKFIVDGNGSQLNLLNLGGTR